MPRLRSCPRSGPASGKAPKNVDDVRPQSQAVRAALRPACDCSSRALLSWLASARALSRLSEFATIPVRGSALAAGYDLSASADCVIPARGRNLVKTDLSMAIPHDCYGRIGAPCQSRRWRRFVAATRALPTILERAGSISA